MGRRSRARRRVGSSADGFAIAVFGSHIRAAAVFLGLQVAATIAIFAFLVDAEYTTIAPWVPVLVAGVEVVGLLALLVGREVSAP